jgi:hypothetical protein
MENDENVEFAGVPQASSRETLILRGFRGDCHSSVTSVPRNRHSKFTGRRH